MSTKKYYWLKLKEDFFSDDTIEWIEEQPNGKEYCLFYLKLCLKSLRTNGILIRNVGEILVPYDVNKLAEITKTSTDTVMVAMELFKKIGLIQILENGEIYLSQLKNMVGSETSKAELMRKKREKEKEVIDGGNNVTKLLPNCYTEIDIDIEIDKEIDKEKDIDIDIDYERIVNLYSSNCPPFTNIRSLTATRKEAIKKRIIINKYTYKDFENLFNMAAETPFLRGEGKDGWKANFDWLIRENNMAKVLEGTYAERKPAEDPEEIKTNNPFLEMLREEGEI